MSNGSGLNFRELKEASMTGGSRVRAKNFRRKGVSFSGKTVLFLDTNFFGRGNPFWVFSGFLLFRRDGHQGQTGAGAFPTPAGRSSFRARHHGTSIGAVLKTLPVNTRRTFSARVPPPN
jgi:hypothetical protein